MRHAVSVQYAELDRAARLAGDLEMAGDWIADVRSSDVRNWESLERHFAQLLSVLTQHPPVPEELALALGPHRPALYRGRLEAALRAATTTQRPIAVLAALRGTSEEAVKQLRYIRKTIRIPIIRFHPVQVGRRRVIVREERDPYGRPVWILVAVDDPTAES